MERKVLELSDKLWDKSRNYYEKVCSDEDEYKDILDYRQLHSKIVADLAIKFFDDYYEDLFEIDKSKRTVLYLAGLTHDIKKMDKNHNEEGAKFIKDALESPEFKVFNDKMIEEIYKIIKYHKAKKEKKKDLEYIQDIDILGIKTKTVILFIRIADKLSKLVYKSRYKMICEKAVDEKMFGIINKSIEFIWDKEKLERIFDLINKDFKENYCKNHLTKEF